MVTFEALEAKFGDCLLLRYKDTQDRDRLWIIDGGPAGVYLDALKPRLAALPGPRDANGVLRADLVAVSHIDDDHINGIAQLLRKMVEQKSARKPPFLAIDQLWFNSFSKLLSCADPAVGAQAASLASAGQSLLVQYAVTNPVAAAVLASVGQGENVTRDAVTLGLNGDALNNAKPLLAAPQSFAFAGAQVTVLGPQQSRLDQLKQEWRMAAGDKAAQTSALDDSVPNLSSIVLLVEVAGKKILLAGDGRGDDIVQGWLDNGGRPDAPCPVDILKMPHHGSIRNTTKEFLEMFPAQHYILSANGKYENPDDATLKLLVKSQGDRRYAIHVTCPILTYAKGKAPEPTDRVAKLLAELQQGRSFEYHIGGGVALTL